MQLNNKVQLLGHLGNNPEIRTLENGNKLAKMSLATYEPYKDAKGKKVDKTQWHNIVAWGATAEIAEKYLAKGKQVLVEGRLVHNSYTDKEGQKRYTTDVNVSHIMLLDKKSA